MTTSATPHLFWITSRAAGIVALVLASLAVSLGLLMSTKLLKRRGPDLLAIHEILSLSAIVAIVVHGVSLIGDHYLHPTLADIAIPFASSYKTFWTSTGIIAGWGLALLGLSYYARKRIGAVRWRKLHRFTALFWLLGLGHSIGEGTDAGQLWFIAMIAIVVIPAAMLLVFRHGRSSGTPARPSGNPTRPSGTPARPAGTPGQAPAIRARPGRATPEPAPQPALAVNAAAGGAVAAESGPRPALWAEPGTRPLGSSGVAPVRARQRRPLPAAEPLTAPAGAGRRSR